MCIAFIISQNLVVYKFRDNFRQNFVEFRVELALGWGESPGPLGLKLSRAPLRQVPGPHRYPAHELTVDQ